MKKVFFPKNFAERYSHIGVSYFDCPKVWDKEIKRLVKIIEKSMWPSYMPKWSKRLIHYLALKNAYHIKYPMWANLRAELTNNCFVCQIKEKFGDLRVYVDNPTREINYAILKITENCSKICQNCGESKEDVDYTTNEKGWIVKYCEKCTKDALKIKNRTKSLAEY